MNNPLVILITGASRGIGMAIAEAFASDKQGNTLILAARNKEKLDAEAISLQSRFPRATVLAHAADLAHKEEVLALAAWVSERFEAVDVLVNNAGYFLPGSVGEEADNTLETLWAVNLSSAYHLTRALLPGMKARQKGHIFNICSIASMQAYPNGGSYGITKHAMLGMGKNLREELKPHGIKVTNILPGATYTDSWAASGLPEDRFMKASDIASMVYCCTHLSAGACVEEIIMRPQLGDI